MMATPEQDTLARMGFVVRRSFFTPRQVCWLLLGVALVSGLQEGWEDRGHASSPGWTVLVAVVFSFLSFYWYRVDSEERGYPRSWGLNGAILVCGIVAFPYYLARSRPWGRKARAVLKLAGFVLLLMVATGLGAALWGLLG